MGSSWKLYKIIQSNLVLIGEFSKETEISRIAFIVYTFLDVFLEFQKIYKF